MRSFSIIILLGTSCLVTGNTNYYGQHTQDSHNTHPIDYFDDIYNHDMKLNPSSTFSFNFEQTRRDQPPQIEMREETVGKYFNRKPQTTTPASIFSMNTNKQPQHVYPSIAPPNNYQQNWNQQQVSSVPPPPQFAFSKDQRPNSQPERQRNSSPLWNTPTVNQNIQPRNSFNTNLSPVPNVQAQPLHNSQWTQLQTTQTTPSYHVPTPSRFGGPQASPLSSRGNHKFSWHDIKKPEEIKPNTSHQQVGLTQVSTTPQSIHNNPPPPVPTLSPWYDNFGK